MGHISLPSVLLSLPVQNQQDGDFIGRDTNLLSLSINSRPFKSFYFIAFRLRLSILQFGIFT